MRLRLQKLSSSEWGWAWVRVATKADDGPWTSVRVRQSQVDRYERQAGIEDSRDSAELFSQARAAWREWGCGGGFAEWSPTRGVRRFPGAIDQESSAGPPPSSCLGGASR